MATPRKIVFTMPSLLPEGGTGRRAAPDGRAAPASPTDATAPGEVADVRKLAMLWR